MAANSITENMFAQVDEEGNRHVLFDKIVEHRCDGNQVNMQDAFSANTRGVQQRRPTTKGWEILVKWKDGKYNLDFTQGYKRIISGSTGRIC